LKKISEFIIPFIGMKEGEHTFNYVIRKSFLEKFDNSEIKDIVLNVEVKMIKNNRLYEFRFHLKGSAQVECDRCLDEFNMPVDYQSRLFVKTEDIENAEDDIVYLKSDESEIDISQFIYENIIFSLPQKRVHPDIKGKSQCNPEMLKKLNSLSANKSNKTPDPRWNEFKKMLNNLIK